MKHLLLTLSITLLLLQGSAQNVGIGTTAPFSQFKLHVQDTNNHSKLLVQTLNGNSMAGVVVGTPAPVGYYSSNFMRFGGDMPTSYYGFPAANLTAVTSDAAGGLLLGNGSAFPVYFMTGSTERMRIEGSGTIGINNSSPDASALLDIAGTDKGVLFPRMTSLQRTSIASPADGLLVYDISTRSFWQYNGGNFSWEQITKNNNPQLNLWLTGSNAVYVNNALDNRVVVVGNSFPMSVANSFELYGKTGGSGNTLLIQNAAGTSGNGLYSLTDGTGSAGQFIINSSTNTQAALYAGTNGAGFAASFSMNNPSANADAMSVTTNSLGAAALFLKSGGGGAPVIDVTTTGSGGHGGNFTITNALNGNSAVNAASAGYGAAGRFINTNNALGYAGLFEISNPSNGTSAVMVSTAGIGSAGVFNSLNTGSNFPTLAVSNSGNGRTASFSNGTGVEIVSASTGLTHQLTLQQTNTSYARLLFKNSTGNAWTIAALRTGTAATDQLNFYNEQVNADRFVLYGNGNATLSGTLTQLSDLRLKTNIQPMENVLPRLLELNSYTYNWKEESRGTDKQIGLLAQEVEAVFPELVRTDINGNKSVAYQNLVPVLLQAIKEQQQQIDELKKERHQNK